MIRTIDKITTAQQNQTKFTMKKRLPNFIGIGTQKGGTTTLHRLLSNHPEVFLPKCKELHYFDLNYNKGALWYMQHFNHNNNIKCYGEITPHYIFHLKSPLRIKETVPDAKLIILLRDPIERTLSHFFHAKKKGFEPLNLEEALDAEPKRMKSQDESIRQRNSYISRSKYMGQLKRYESLFHPSQIIVQKSEDLFSNQNEIWGNILEFLSLDRIEPTVKSIQANKGENTDQQIDSAILMRLSEMLESTYKEVEDQYGFTWQNGKIR
jgi:hypothetical protein